MRCRVTPRLIPLLLLGVTACGDATVIVRSDVPRDGQGSGASVRVVAADASDP
jgi:hypothetical protein